ncbi:hypothetical protein [Burkholderia ubonensis]|uniref:hypothetical protein n=1 Tax=Burkholderia ubonensis TaxID=101571 RepID=UPI0007608182|nr:hypothetical protein [Burkholderia ubonensis]
MRSPSLLYKTASLLNERRLDTLVGTVVLTADMEAHNGTLDEHGKPGIRISCPRRQTCTSVHDFQYDITMKPRAKFSTRRSKAPMTKEMLLPLSAGVAQQKSLQHHLALASLQTGNDVRTRSGNCSTQFTAHISYTKRSSADAILTCFESLRPRYTKAPLVEKQATFGKFPMTAAQR